MNQKSTKFIGRTDELDLIEHLIHREETLEFVCIYGQGGIGKTRMLQEVLNRYQNAEGLFISPVFDFDDPSFQILRNFRTILADHLQTDDLHPYLKALGDLRKMELASISPERLVSEIETIDRIFVSCFNSRIAPKQRTILLMDTIEAIQGEYIWENYLLKQLSKLKNTVVIFAGRQLDKAQDDLQTHVEAEALHLISLEGFSLNEANEYFDWSQVGREIETELREKLHHLAGGRPILIDLAIDWLRWDIPLPDILNTPLNQITALKPQKLEELLIQFEQSLVMEILGFVNPTDRAVLDMACIHRFFNADILAFLLNLSPVKAKEMIRNLAEFTFVKPRPQNNFALHDEMRRMINKYAWPRYDPFGTQKKKTHAKITKYYELQTDELTQKIHQAAIDREQARKENLTQQELKLTQKQSNYERDYWLLKIEHLHHCLRFDLKQALEIFKASADQATAEFRYEYRRVIFDEILQFEDNFKSPAQYEIYIRQAKYSLDKGQYETACRDLTKLYKKYADGAEREIDILVQLGNATIRLGKSNETLKHFQKALAICEQKNLKQWLGLILNELGWTNRILGNWDEAIKYYDSALEHSEKAQDTMSLADTLNNLGYVYNLKGDYASAQAYCQQALEIRISAGLVREIGMSHNTLSIIFRSQGDYDTALQQSNQALGIFRSQNDIEWLGKVHRERGVTRYYIGQFEMARNDLKQSLNIFNKYDSKNELPTTYHRLGHVMWDLALRERQHSPENAASYLQEAENLFKQSFKLGMDIADAFAAVNSLAGLIELLYDLKTVTNTDRVSDLKQYYKTLQKLDKKSAFHYPLYLGNAERIMGAVEQDAGHLSRALTHYKHSFPLIARYSGHNRYILNTKAIPFLDKKMAELPAPKAIKWCDELIKHWEHEKLALEYPEFINYCKVWKMGRVLTIRLNK